MYNPRKDIIKHGFHMVLVLLCGMFFMFTALYPRPTQHRNFNERDFKADFHDNYRDLPVLEWPTVRLKPAVEDKEREAQAAARQTDSSGEKACAIIAEHRNGLVSGKLVAYSVQQNGFTRQIKEYANIPFRISDKDMPGIIRGEVRKYDLAHSRLFKYSYISVLALLVLTYWYYTQISSLWRQTYAEKRTLTDSLAEFRHYLRLRIDVLKERKQPLTPELLIGDIGYARKFYWHEVAYGLIVIFIITCTMTWKGYIAPPISKGEVNLAFEKANDVFIDYTLAKNSLGNKLDAADRTRK